MKRSRFADGQIIGILKEQEAGQRTADICRRHEVSEGTFYKWQAEYGALDVSEAKRLKALRTSEEVAGRRDAGQRHAEGCRCKKMVTPAARREAVAYLRAAHGVSERRRVLCWERIAPRSATDPGGRAMGMFESGCAPCRGSAVVSVIGVCICCWRGRGSR